MRSSGGSSKGKEADTLIKVIKIKNKAKRKKKRTVKKVWRWIKKIVVAVALIYSGWNLFLWLVYNLHF